jgi:hypothetical protein
MSSIGAAATLAKTRMAFPCAYLGQRTADPGNVERHLGILSTILPTEAYDLIVEQVRRIASTSDRSLSWGFLLSVAVAVWSHTSFRMPVGRNAIRGDEANAVGGPSSRDKAKHG